MKKLTNLVLGLAAVAMLVLLLSPMGFSRLTGTNPGDDIWCMGPSGAEVCVDSSGNFIPTTTNDASLGTSSLRFSNVYTTLLNVSGALTASSTLGVNSLLTATGGITSSANILGYTPSAQTIVAAGPITANACGGLKSITTNAAGNVTIASTNIITAPTALSGCLLTILNVGTDSIVIPQHEDTAYSTYLFYTAGSHTQTLGQFDSIRVASNGTAWYQVGTLTNH